MFAPLVSLVYQILGNLRVAVLLRQNRLPDTLDLDFLDYLRHGLR